MKNCPLNIKINFIQKTLPYKTVFSIDNSVQLFFLINETGVASKLSTTKVKIEKKHQKREQLTTYNRKKSLAVKVQSKKTTDNLVEFL